MCVRAVVQIMTFTHFFLPIFELQDITKHLMTGPGENCEFCFTSTSMFAEAKRRASGKQTSLSPLGPVIKFLLSSCEGSVL